MSQQKPNRAPKQATRTTSPSGRRSYSRNEKIFYVISLLVVLSMIVGLVAVAITPAGF